MKPALRATGRRRRAFMVPLSLIALGVVMFFSMLLFYHMTRDVHQAQVDVLAAQVMEIGESLKAWSRRNIETFTPGTPRAAPIGTLAPNASHAVAQLTLVEQNGARRFDCNVHIGTSRAQFMQTFSWPTQP